MISMAMFHSYVTIYKRVKSPQTTIFLWFSYGFPKDKLIFACENGFPLSVAETTPGAVLQGNLPKQLVAPLAPGVPVVPGQLLFCFQKPAGNASPKRRLP